MRHVLASLRWRHYYAVLVASRGYRDWDNEPASRSVDAGGWIQTTDAEERVARKVQLLIDSVSLQSADVASHHYYNDTRSRGPFYGFFPFHLGEPVSPQRRDILTRKTTGFLWAGYHTCHSAYNVNALQENAVVCSSWFLIVMVSAPHPMSNQQCQKHWRS